MITVDDTDSCCKIRRNCYEEIEFDQISSDDNETYHALYYDDDIQCVDKDSTYNYAMCQCDKKGAQCLKEYLSSFNINNKNISSPGFCQNIGNSI